MLFNLLLNAERLTLNAKTLSMKLEAVCLQLAGLSIEPGALNIFIYYRAIFSFTLNCLPPGKSIVIFSNNGLPIVN
jgi:hypothetical protein